jgi:hypothetical protein
MKKIIIFIVILALVGIGAWVLLGKNEITPSGEEVTTPGEEEESSLTDILGKTKDISSLKYDMVTSVPGQATVTTKMWTEGKKMRMEMVSGQKSMVYLVDTDKQEAYMYFPSDNMAMKIDLDTAQETVGESPAEQSGSITNANPVIVGDEILDGKSCLVAEYAAPTGTVKMWIWKDYGLSIKTEAQTADGKMTTELKNIDFSDIDDTMFELPAGVQITQTPAGF